MGVMSQEERQRLEDQDRERAAQTITRAPVFETALQHARARRGSGNVGPRYLQDLLRYVEELEVELTGERTKRRDFEAQAEGEFCDLRLDRHRWRTYAAQLEARGYVLKGRLAALVSWADPTPVHRWWQRRRRREDRERLLQELNLGRAALADPEPAPPAVEPGE